MGDDKKRNADERAGGAAKKHKSAYAKAQVHIALDGCAQLACLCIAHCAPCFHHLLCPSAALHAWLDFIPPDVYRCLRSPVLCPVLAAADRHVGSDAQPKHPSEKAIPAGAVGLFLTCEAGRERRAADEIVAMLEDTYTRLGAQDAGAHSAEPSSTKGASVDALLAAEVAQLRDKSKDRFKRHDTGVRGTAFVELPVGDGASVCAKKRCVRLQGSRLWPCALSRQPGVAGAATTA
jgi:hypothetical protein